MAILKAPLRLSRALYPMGSMLLASHPGGMESAWLRAANPPAAIAKAPPAAAHRGYFMERIRFPRGCGQWAILERISLEWNRVKGQPKDSFRTGLVFLGTRVISFHGTRNAVAMNRMSVERRRFLRGVPGPAMGLPPRET